MGGGFSGTSMLEVDCTMLQEGVGGFGHTLVVFQPSKMGQERR